MLTKCPTNARDDSHGNLICRWPICAPLFPPLIPPMTSTGVVSQKQKQQATPESGSVAALSKLSSCNKVFHHLIPAHSSCSPSAAFSSSHLIQGMCSLSSLASSSAALPSLALNPLPEPATAAPYLHQPTRRP